MASLLVVVVAPLAVAILGYCFMRDPRLPNPARADPWLLVLAVLGGMGLLAVLPDEREIVVQFIWFTVLAALVTHLALTLRSARPQADARE